MASFLDPLTEGKRCRSAGQLGRAEQLLRQALQAQPSNFEILHLLANTCQDQGKLPESVQYFREAIRLAPQRVEGHNGLGISLTMMGRLQEALVSFQQALAINPMSAEAHNNMGTVFQRLGNHAQAAASFAEAVRLRPHFAEGYNNLGVALLNAGDLEKALANFQRAVELKPDHMEAHKNAGIALRDLGRLDEAVASFEAALGLKPDYADGLISLGLAQMQQRKIEQAIASYQRALEIKPDFAEGHNNLGIMYLEQGRIEDALTQYRKTIRLRPDYPDGHWNHALLLLLLGDFRHGWLEYEWRRKLKNVGAAIRQPLWTGTPLEGRTILVFTEQGAGDTFQFVRYAPLVKQRGGRVLFACRESMLPILSRCPGIDQFMAHGTPPPPFDFFAPLMSLPGIFETTLETIPSSVPYVFADAALVESWRKQLQGIAGFRLGIAWQGDPKYPGDRHRSIPLANFEPLAHVKGVSLISLQKGPGVEQIAHLDGRFQVTDLGNQLDTSGGAFTDTAAAMMNLDLVITSDTSIPHLAGALGVPVWVVLGKVPDWRFLLDRDDSPWYPTMCLFRQKQLGDWRSVFEVVAAELEKLVATKEQSARSSP